MPNPPERRRAAKAAVDDDDEPQQPVRPPPPPPRNYNTYWALATGLAVGFLVGREAHRFGSPSSNTATATSGSAIPIKADPAGPKAYASESEFPAGWVKSADLPTAITSLADLNDAQKTTVMQALNERQCECGCAYGKLSTCLQKDPNCPRSPAMAKLAADLVKQGKGLAEILTAIDSAQRSPAKPAANPAPEAPTKPVYVEIAAWNPRKGPNPAKVTIVEFSDFQ